jgi:hypothetical protein
MSRHFICDTAQKHKTRSTTIWHNVHLTPLMPAAQTEHDVLTVRYDAAHTITETAWTQNKTTKTCQGGQPAGPGLNVKYEARVPPC